ncbi:hypothetical protein ACU686_24905 [Yinghuangia aomiensis]
MGDLLQFAVIGFSTGAVYAVLGTSLVGLYAATGVLNFAQGSVALWAILARPPRSAPTARWCSPWAASTWARDRWTPGPPS